MLITEINIILLFPRIHIDITQLHCNHSVYSVQEASRLRCGSFAQSFKLQITQVTSNTFLFCLDVYIEV